MSRRANSRLRIAAALCVAVVFAALHAGVAFAGSLEPYRVFARSAEGARLLALARATLTAPDSLADAENDDEAFDDTTDAAAESEEDLAPTDYGWPGPPVAVYLTLVNNAGTRACVGVTAPGYGTLSETVRELALDARYADRRRSPVRDDELADLRIVIAFADEGVPITSPIQVDPGREGLAIDSDRGSVAYLPGEARTVSWALAEARRAGIIGPKSGEVHYRKFRVVTLGERKPRPARPRRSRAEEETDESEAGR